MPEAPRLVLRGTVSPVPPKAALTLAPVGSVQARSEAPLNQLEVARSHVPAPPPAALLVRVGSQLSDAAIAGLAELIAASATAPASSALAFLPPAYPVARTRR